jgi:hypothetical protein
MADILVRCPKTGQEVSTGLKTEWVMFETLPGIQMPLTCPACGETHNWRSKDAWISNHNGAVETVTLEKAWHEIERLRSDNRDLARMLAAAREQLEEKLKVQDELFRLYSERSTESPGAVRTAGDHCSARIRR